MASVLQTFVQIILNCLFLYLAVLPVIAVAARIPNGHMVGMIIAFAYGYGGMFAAGNMTLANLYPITASMGLIQYRSYDEAVHWNTGLCELSIMAAFLISAVIVTNAKNVSPEKTTQKQKKVKKKAGKWRI